MINIDKIKDILDKDGYIILKKALKLKNIKALTSIVTKIFSAHAKLGEDIYSTCVRLGSEDKELLYRIYQYSQSMLVMDNLRQECFQYAKPLFPKDSIFIDIDSHVIVNLPHDDRIGWGWHQESTYHPEIESCIGFWFPFLESSTRSNGTMSVLRGSNRLGRLPYTIHKPSNDSATTLVPDNMEQFQSQFPEVYCFLDPTDLLIFHMNLLHRTNPNTSDRPRFTGIVRIACIDHIPGQFGKIT